MFGYVVFCKDYDHRKGDLLGILVERRNDTRGLTQWESGLKWAREAFGHLVKDKRDIFVSPQDLKIREDKTSLAEKGVFSKQEYLEMIGGVDREMKEART